MLYVPREVASTYIGYLICTTKQGPFRSGLNKNLSWYITPRTLETSLTSTHDKTMAQGKSSCRTRKKFSSRDLATDIHRQTSRPNQSGPQQHVTCPHQMVF